MAERESERERRKKKRKKEERKKRGREKKEKERREGESISFMYHWYNIIFFINIPICLSTINLFLVIFNSRYSPFSPRLLQTLPSAWAEGGWRKSITEYSTVPYTESCSRRPIGFHLSVLSSDMLGPKPLWLAESANTRIKSDMHLLYRNWTSL